MSLHQSVTRSLLCRGCRTQLFQSFVPVGLGLPALRETNNPSWQQRNTRLSDQRSHFSTCPALLSDSSSPIRQPPFDFPDFPDQTPSKPDQLDTTSPPPPSENEAAVPWYLQVDAPITQESHPLSERQRLPDLPNHPPEILQTLLEHISTDLGMDDLSLLDLRSLDPPPALGANLLMIIATARSEKHLHVSADRLCRWLRSNHGLTPIADGLLGRNELKLKLRRKAKRSRLLSAVGAKETGSGDMDDGIKTGWVCVNVGRVSGGVLPDQKAADAQKIDNFVGFGSTSSGCNIVVQIMTDEKRGLMDLETLWQGILKRNKQAQRDYNGGAQDDTPQSELSLN